MVARILGSIKAKISSLIDVSIMYSVLYRLWGLSAGLVTLFFLTRYFTPEVQGYYYIFLSLIALQVVIELGLFTVIINFASHEWSKLHLDDHGLIVGDKESLSRLVDLGQGILRWYSLVVILFILLAGSVGIFMLPTDDHDIWFWPWCLVVLFAGLHLLALPFLSLLEGCGQVAKINKFRLYLGIVSSVFLWLSMFLGLDLWSMAVSAFMMVALDSYLILYRYRAFFRPVWNSKPTANVDWLREIWPMQWRLALQSISGYFVLQFITPVVFYFNGAVDAGIVGMTMQLCFAIQTVGHAWMQTKLPIFGNLVAKKDFVTLNSVWIKYSTLSVGVVITLGAGLILCVYLGFRFEWAVMGRVLDVECFFILVIAQVCSQIIQCQASYLRAFRQEFFVLPGFFGGIFAAIFIWVGVSTFGVSGGIYGYAFSIFIMMCWTSLIFRSKRNVTYGIHAKNS
jgi:O-antigen/teichoic acid export membrane protein